MARERRKIVVSPQINTPEPFAGFGGFCGWPRICRLQNGDLYVAFSAGYGHASWVNPRPDLPPQYAAYMERMLEGGATWAAPAANAMCRSTGPTAAAPWSPSAQ